MILLEFHNRILEETLLKAFSNTDKPEAMKMMIADFDGVLFKVHTPDDKSKIIISISCKCFKQLKDAGAQDYLKRIYGNLLTTPESGQDVAVTIDLNSLPADKDELAHRVALLKRHCFAAPFEKAFGSQAKGGDTSTTVIDYRDEESMYIRAASDRVTVTFSVLFKDADDVIIGKVFLQEFVEARRKQQQAPQVLYYYKTPPTELKGLNCREGDDWGYVTFVLTPRHFDAKHKESTIDLTMTFRDYLHYHIKCCKAYLHSRMRLRVASLLKVLNRARPEDKSKAQKTATGRTFTRKV